MAYIMAQSISEQLKFNYLEAMKDCEGKPKTVLANITGATCAVINGDSREELKAFENKVDLIVTSPPYADARKKHYDSIPPDMFVEWFMTFNEVFYNALKPTGSLVGSYASSS